MVKLVYSVDSGTGEIVVSDPMRVGAVIELELLTTTEPITLEGRTLGTIMGKDQDVEFPMLKGTRGGGEVLGTTKLWALEEPATWVLDTAWVVDTA